MARIDPLADTLSLYLQDDRQSAFSTCYDTLDDDFVTCSALAL